MLFSNKLLAGTAVVLALAGPAFAQTTAPSDMDNTQPPAAAEQPLGQDHNGMNADKVDTDSVDAGEMKPGKDKARKADSNPVDGMQDTTVTGSAALTDDSLPTEPILTVQTSGQIVSDDIIGTDVRNATDDSIGTIDALVIDDQNRVVAGIVSVGGFLGIGAKDVAVNWKEFTFQLEEDVAVVSLDRETLENAPAFRERAEVKAEYRIEDRDQGAENRQDRLRKSAEPPLSADPDAE